MRAFGKSTPRGNPELGRVMRRYPDELPGPVSVEKGKKGTGTLCLTQINSYVM